MPDKLKDLFFKEEYFSRLGNAIQKVYPEFDQAHFKQLIYGEAWDSMELKEKMRHTSRCLAATLPEEYPAALAILTKVAPGFTGFNAMIFPDFVECYGLDHWDISLPALALFTRYCSSEFAIRPFLAKDPEKAMAYMREWAMDENPHLRRLASEGCRPRLPWAMALSVFKKDPKPILPVLEILKDDSSEYVRKSVANNLNDISKDHPQWVLEISERWLGQSDNTDWIVKHACRTLLKQGHTQALLLFGFGNPENIRIKRLVFDKESLQIGEDIRFTFEMEVDGGKAKRIRLEYGLDFVKSTGKLLRKIFQIREASFDPGSHTISRKHKFQDLSTRKHYPGQHRMAILVNGVEKASANFELKVNR